MNTRSQFSAFLLTGLLLLTAMGLFAQNRHRQVTAEDRERIESHKIAYLTDKLDLTPAEAEKFWPVYNTNHDRMETERKRFRESLDVKREEDGQLSDENATALIQSRLGHEQKMLDLKKDYYNELKGTLSPQKIVRLFEAEKGFREELIRQVSRRHAPQDRR